MCCDSYNRRAALAAAAAVAAVAAAQRASVTFPSYSSSILPIQAHLAQPTKKKETLLVPLLGFLLLINRTVPTSTTTTFDSAAKPKQLQKKSNCYKTVRSLACEINKKKKEDVVNACVGICTREP